MRDAVPLLILSAAAAMSPTALAQYSGLQPVLTAAKPIRLESSSSGTLVRFGPATLVLPSGWQALPGQLGSDLLTSSGDKFNLLLLERPESMQSSQLPPPKTTVLEAMQILCSPSKPAAVAPLPSNGNAPVYVSSCSSKSYDGGAMFQVFYELREGSYVLQLIGSGRGTVVQARRVADKVALSARVQ